jgi:hypothetical protein
LTLGGLVPFYIFLLTISRVISPAVGFFVQASGWIGALCLVIWGITKLHRRIQNPLLAHLRGYFDAPDYASKVAFVERFHEDFDKIVAAYVGSSKVFVFIDDLDRCEIPKAAELMQAINMMISDNNRLVLTFINSHNIA